MTPKKDALKGLAPRSSQFVALLDEPPLGHLQALVLKKIDDLGRDAFGYNILEQLSIEGGVWIDHAQIYASIRRFLKKVPEPYIALVGTRPSVDGGPPLKIYKLTKAGRAALKQTTDHHVAMAEFLLPNVRSVFHSLKTQRKLVE